MLKLSRLNILLSLVASLTSLSLGAASPQSPRLLVGIMVEGLDGDCLELLAGSSATAVSGASSATASQ